MEAGLTSTHGFANMSWLSLLLHSSEAQLGCLSMSLTVRSYTSFLVCHCILVFRDVMCAQTTSVGHELGTIIVH